MIPDTTLYSYATPCMQDEVTRDALPKERPASKTYCLTGIHGYHYATFREAAHCH